jgi:hypothetical protein
MSNTSVNPIILNLLTNDGSSGITVNNSLSQTVFNVTDEGNMYIGGTSYPASSKLHFGHSFYNIGSYNNGRDFEFYSKGAGQGGGDGDFRFVFDGGGSYYIKPFDTTSIKFATDDDDQRMVFEAYHNKSTDVDNDTLVFGIANTSAYYARAVDKIAVFRTTTASMVESTTVRTSAFITRSGGFVIGGDVTSRTALKSYLTVKSSERTGYLWDNVTNMTVTTNPSNESQLKFDNNSNGTIHPDIMVGTKITANGESRTVTDIIGTNNYAILLDSDATWTTQNFTYKNPYLYFEDDSSNALVTVDPDGYMSIGHGSPTEKLDLVGNFKIDGNIVSPYNDSTSALKLVNSDTVTLLDIDSTGEATFEYTTGGHTTKINGSDITLGGYQSVGNYIYASDNSYLRFPVTSGSQYFRIRPGDHASATTEILRLETSNAGSSYTGWNFHNNTIKIANNHLELIRYRHGLDNSYTDVEKGIHIGGSNTHPSYQNGGTYIYSTDGRSSETISYDGQDIFLYPGKKNLTGNDGNVVVGASDRDANLLMYSGEIQLADNTVTISRDIYDNLVFEDPNAGIKTLSELLPTSGIVTVGTGGNYSDISAAITGGATNIKLVSDVTEGSDITLTADMIIDLGGYELDMEA